MAAAIEVLRRDSSREGGVKRSGTNHQVSPNATSDSDAEKKNGAR